MAHDVHEMPTIANCCNASNSYAIGDMFGPSWVTTTAPYTQPLIARDASYDYEGLLEKARAFEKQNVLLQPKKEIRKMAERRIIQVFIVDTDKNVPLDKSVLYRGEQKLTDSTDEELFFEVDIKRLLDAHNEFRTTCLDKKATKAAGKDVLLEAARIRDLKMVVTNIAEF